MHMLYDSDQYAVVVFDAGGVMLAAGAPASPDELARGGYEIVDKFSRRGIYLEGLLAEQFKEGVEALVATEPDEDDFDAYVGRFALMAQQPVVMH